MPCWTGAAVLVAADADGKRPVAGSGCCRGRGALPPRYRPRLHCSRSHVTVTPGVFFSFLISFHLLLSSRPPGSMRHAIRGGDRVSFSLAFSRQRLP